MCGPQSLGQGWSHSPGFDRRIPTAVDDFVAWMVEMELTIPGNMLGGVRLLEVTLELRVGNCLTKSCDLSPVPQFCVAVPPATETTFFEARLKPGKEGLL